MEKMVEAIIRKGKSLVRKVLTKAGLLRNLIINSPIVYHANGNSVTYLKPDPGLMALPLIDEFIIPPGCYKFQNQSYELSQDGLYRFMFPEKINEQRIVFTGNMPALMSSLAWIVAHGESDDALSHDSLIQKAKQQKLFLTCEAVCEFAFTILTGLGLRCRIIGTRTLEQWNSYDDGHYLIEVYRNDLNKWVLYDLDTDSYFTHYQKPLSFLEFMQHIETADYDIQPLSADIRAESVSSDQRYDFTFINEGKLASLKLWYKRVMQFTFITHEQEHFAHPSHASNKKLTRRYPKGAFPAIQYLDHNAFINRFYQ